MKAIRIHEFGGTENLRLDEIEKPIPKADEVLIKTAAAGINFADTMMRAGNYLTKPSLPVVLGFEAAGTITEIGENVQNFKVGDKVLGAMSSGGYAEYAVAEAAHLIPIPDEISYGEATALLVQGMTALGLLQGAKPEDTILIHAAAGGVGSLLVQLAKYKGLNVIGTASSAQKLEKIVKYGADFAVDYTQSDWTEQILQITENKGVDIIIEMVGGDVVGENLKVLALNGTMWIYGAATGKDYKISALGLMNKNHIVRGYWLTLEKPEKRAAFAGELLRHVAEKRLHLEITEYPLEQAAEAHKAIEGRKTTGKVVLTMAK